MPEPGAFNLEEMLAGRPASRERLLAALRGGQPDYVPMFDFLNSQNLYETLLGRRPAAYNARDAVEASLMLGVDGVFIPFGGFKGYNPAGDATEDPSLVVDEWGTTYQDTGKTWPAAAPVAYPISGPGDLHRYEMPDPTLPHRLDGIRDALQLAQGRTAILGGINGPLTVAFVLAGWETIMTSLYDCPRFLDDLLKIGAEYYGEACRRMIEAGVDAICLAEDLGFSSGLFMSPEHYRRHLFPLLGDLVRIVKDAGLLVLMHCDGNINPILPDLVDIGINGYNPVERKAGMDIVALKQRFGSRLCLVGNVDSTDTLCSGRPAAVENEVRELIEKVAPGGGFILCSDSDVRNEMPVLNILTMFRAGRLLGSYCR